MAIEGVAHHTLLQKSVYTPDLLILLVCEVKSAHHQCHVANTVQFTRFRRINICYTSSLLIAPRGKTFLESGSDWYAFARSALGCRTMPPQLEHTIFYNQEHQHQHQQQQQYVCGSPVSGGVFSPLLRGILLLLVLLVILRERQHIIHPSTVRDTGPTRR
jgi:hypothetical protein